MNNLIILKNRKSLFVKESANLVVQLDEFFLAIKKTFQQGLKFNLTVKLSYEDLITLSKSEYSIIYKSNELSEIKIRDAFFYKVDNYLLKFKQECQSCKNKEYAGILRKTCIKNSECEHLFLASKELQFYKFSEYL